MADKFIETPRPDFELFKSTLEERGISPDNADRLYRIVYGLWENANWLKENGGSGGGGGGGGGGVSPPTLEFCFARYSEDSIPDDKQPLNSWGYQDFGTVNGVTYATSARNLTDDEPYGFIASRVFTGAPNVGDEITDEWSDTALNGSIGEPGPAGKGVTSIVRSGNTVTITYTDGTTDDFTVKDVDRVSVLSNGNIQILFSDGTSVTIPKGQAGKGIRSVTRDENTGVVTVTFDDGTTQTFVIADGSDGRGVRSIAKSGSTVTITYTDGSTDDFTVADGVGVRSVQTETDGDVLITFTDGRTITIPKGQAGKGIKRIERDSSTGIVTVTFDDDTTQTFTLMDGEDGRGIRGIVRNADTGLITITYTDGSTDTFTIADGTPGTSIGIRSIVTQSNGNIVVTFSNGDSFTIPAAGAGRGIRSITRTGNTVVVTYDDGGTDRFGLRDGTDGIGIRSLTKAGTTVTVTYTDGSTDTFTVNDGADGTSVSVSSVNALANGNIQVVFSDGTTAQIPKGKGIKSVSRDGDTGVVTITFDDDTTNMFTIADGTDGTGVRSISRGSDGTVTVTYTNGDTDSFTIRDGRDGVDGTDGRGVRSFSKVGSTVTVTYTDDSTDTFTVEDGADGSSITVSNVRTLANGNIQITFSDSSTVQIPKGAAGKGIRTISRNASTGVVTVTFDDDSTQTFTVADGADGRGVRSIAKSGNTVTITYTDDSTDDFTVSDGVGIRSTQVLTNGDIRITFTDDSHVDIPKGRAGKGIASVTRSGNTVTVTYDDGSDADTFIVRDGVDGTDGEDGRGIRSVTKSDSTVTITYTDSSTDTFTVEDGADGSSITVTNVRTLANGNIQITFSDSSTVQIPKGAAGKGIRTISRNASTGVVTVTFDDDSTQTFTVADGADGRGVRSISKSGNTVTVTYTDGNTDDFTVSDGVGIRSTQTLDNGNIRITFTDDTFVDIPKGQAGKGIRSISRTGDTVTVTYDDGSAADTFTVMDGADGADGRGVRGISKSGTTVTVTYTDSSTDTFTVADGVGVQSVTTLASGNIRITFTDSSTVDIPKGQAGRGIQSISRASNGVVTVTFDDNTSATFTVRDGRDGTDGRGVRGISKSGTTVTITYTDDSTDTFTVADGVGVRTVQTLSNGNIRITFTDGNTVDIPKGQAGRGIQSISRAANGLVTITFDDSTTATFTVRDGIDGVGIRSITKSGTTVTVTYTNDNTDTFEVSDGTDGTSVAVTAVNTLANGNIQVVFSDGTTAQIPKGKGIKRVSRDASTGVVTITFDDDTTNTFTIRDGTDGIDGTAGRGVQSIRKVGTTVTVTYTDSSTDTFTVADGVGVRSVQTLSNGNIRITFTDGNTVDIPKGAAGRGIASISRTGNTVTVTYDDSSPDDTFTVRDGRDGVDGEGYEDVYAKYNAQTLPANLRPDNDWGYYEPETITAEESETFSFASGFVYPGSDSWTIEPSNNNRPEITETSIAGTSGTRLIGRIRLWKDSNGDGRLTIIIADSQTETLPVTATSPATRHDLSSDFENNGEVTITQGSNTMTIPMGGDTTEPYNLNNLPAAKQTEIRNWVTRGDGSTAVTVKLSIPGSGSVTWQNTAPDLDETDRYLYNARRAITGQPDVGDAVSADFSEPAIVGVFGQDGTDGRGVRGIAKTGTTVTITYTDSSTDTFTVADGVGVSSVQTLSNGNIRITFTDGNTVDIPKGQAGRGIQRVSRDSATGLVTITFDDSTTTTFTISDGSSISIRSTQTLTNGDVRITFSDGTTVDIPKGQAGKGIRTIVRNNAGLVTITFDDDTTATFTVRDGVDGRGIRGIAKSGSTVTITYTDDSTDTFTLEDGEDGTDGTSVGIQSIQTLANGNIVVTFTNGRSFTIPKGQAGRGIRSVARNASTGVVTVTFDDGTTDTFALRDGVDGVDGVSHEEIYAQYAELSIPTSLYPDNDWGFDQPGTVTASVGARLPMLTSFMYPSTDTWTIEPNPSQRTHITTTALLASSTDNRYFARLRFWKTAGRVTLYIARNRTDATPSDETASSRNDLAEDFENNGEITVTQGSHSITIPMGGTDTTEPYNINNLSAAKQTEIRNWVDRRDGSAATVSLTIPGETLTWLDDAPDERAGFFIFRSRRPYTGDPDVGDPIPGLWKVPPTRLVRSGSIGRDGLPGADYDKWFPFSYGLPYDYKQTSAANAGTSGNGYWTDVTFGSDRYLTFSERDASGVNRRRWFETDTMQRPGRLIALRRDADDDYSYYAYKTKSAFTMRQNSDDHWYAEVEVEAVSSLDYNSPTWDAPSDEEYDIHLLLPLLTTNASLLGGREPGWFYRNVSADIATLMERLDDQNTTVWTGLIKGQADAATPGDNLIGDVVTLYRGSVAQTRTWDGTNWIGYASVITGNLLVPGTIVTALLAANSITADKAAVGFIDAFDLNADNINAGTLHTDRMDANYGSIIEVDAGQITTGTLDAARIDSRYADIIELDADRIVSGTFDAERIGARTINAVKLVVDEAVIRGNIQLDNGLITARNLDPSLLLQFNETYEFSKVTNRSTEWLSAPVSGDEEVIASKTFAAEEITLTTNVDRTYETSYRRTETRGSSSTLVPFLAGWTNWYTGPHGRSDWYNMYTRISIGIQVQTPISVTHQSLDGSAVTNRYRIKLRDDSAGGSGVDYAARDITLDAQNVHGAYIWSDDTTIWVTDQNKAFAYSLGNGNRDSAKDITYDSAQSEATGIWGDSATIWIADYPDRKAYAFRRTTRTRDSSKDITFEDSPRGIWSNGTTMWVGGLGSATLKAYTLSGGARDSGKDITLATTPTGINPVGLWGDGTTIWYNDYTQKKLFAYTIATGARDQSKEWSTNAETTNSHGLWSDGSIAWVVHQSNPSPRKIRAYKLSDGSRTGSTGFTTVYTSPVITADIQIPADQTNLLEVATAANRYTYSTFNTSGTLNFGRVVGNYPSHTAMFNSNKAAAVNDFRANSGWDYRNGQTLTSTNTVETRLQSTPLVTDISTNVPVNETRNVYVDVQGSDNIHQIDVFMTKSETQG